MGLKNYVKGMTFGNFAFYKVVFYSFFITITSTALILLCTSMAAWYISRVGSLVSKIVYYLCVFSMVVPFQMVMYTLARPGADINQYRTIPIHSVSQGQLRHRGHGRHHGPDHAEHPAGDHLLSVLPEAHHQGRGRRSREGIRA